MGHKVLRILIFVMLINLIHCKSDKHHDKILNTKQRPNIILLLTDDQRWDALSYAGNKELHTPHIDALAQQGTYFKNAYVTTSICAVSRASIFSGQYARRHGIWGFSKNFTDTQLQNTYPLLLKKANYTIGFIGKYGIGNQVPEHHFDYWKGFSSQGTFYQKDDGGNPIHLTKKIGHQACTFIRSQKGKTQAFCLSISFKAPHVEGDPGYFVPDTAYENLYEHDILEVPKTATTKYFDHFPKEFLNNNVARNRWKDRFATPTMHQNSIKKYYRLIHGIDVVVGEIMATLKETQQDQNTVIIFTSDNGFYLGEYGLAGKWYGSAPSIRVPMIIFDPRSGVKKRQVISKKVLNIDVAPTILALANVPPPSRMQGKSLTQLIEKPDISWRDSFFYELLWNSSKTYYIPSTEGIVSEDKKYMKYFKDNDTSAIIFEAFYDLKNDPDEINNLIGKPNYQHLEAYLKNQYYSLKKSIR